MSGLRIHIEGGDTKGGNVLSSTLPSRSTGGGGMGVSSSLASLQTTSSSIPSQWSKYDFEMRSNRAATGPPPKLRIRAPPVAVPPLTAANAFTTSSSSGVSGHSNGSDDGGLLTSRTRYERIAQTIRNIPAAQDEGSTISTLVREENQRQLLRARQVMAQSQSAPTLRVSDQLSRQQAQVQKMFEQIALITRNVTLTLQLLQLVLLLPLPSFSLLIAYT
jgi:hypothetical protein